MGIAHVPSKHIDTGLSLTTLLMKKFFLSVWQYIKIKKKKEFIPLLSLLETKEFSEILKMFRERFYICIFSEGNLCGC